MQSILSSWTRSRLVPDTFLEELRCASRLKFCDLSVKGLAIGRDPVEQVWQFLRANFLSNRIFEIYDEIIEASCEAWNRLIERPQIITSIAGLGSYR